MFLLKFLAVIMWKLVTFKFMGLQRAYFENAVNLIFAPVSIAFHSYCGKALLFKFTSTSFGSVFEPK